MYHHRSGKQKQQNKSHKASQGFSSKRLLDKSAGGKVEAATGGAGDAVSGKKGVKAANSYV
jgi:hypothetical protein